MLNKETLTSMLQGFLKTLSLRLELAKIDIVERGSVILTALICGLLALLVGFLVLIFLSIGCAILLGKLIGYGWAFLIVAAFWLLLLVAVIIGRKSLFLGPLIKALYPSIDQPAASADEPSSVPFNPSGNE